MGTLAKFVATRIESNIVRNMLIAGVAGIVSPCIGSEAWRFSFEVSLRDGRGKHGITLEIIKILRVVKVGGAWCVRSNVQVATSSS